MILRKHLSAICLATLTLLSSISAQAVGTRQFKLDTLEAFTGGDLSGVAVTSNGKVRAGWNLASIPIVDASSVWASVVLDNGTIVIGTGNSGHLYRVDAGKVSIAAKTEGLAVSALTVGFNGDIVAGSFPNGAIYRASLKELDGRELKPWVELSDTENVWGLSYDEKKKVVYAGTGPEGKLFRVTDNGTADVYFDSDETHLVSVAVDNNGVVYSGSNGKALLYAIQAPGRARVVHDFDGHDVKAIVVAPANQGSAVFAISNRYAGSFKGIRPPKVAGKITSQKSSQTKKAKPGKGRLMRFDRNGSAELLLKNDKTHFVSLSLDESGMPLVGTGAEGQVFGVDGNHVERLLADTDERQIASIVATGKTQYLVSSDPAVLHPITGIGGADAVWTSKVLDAQIRAHFGTVEWRSDGALEVQTRTGNAEKPDKTWSKWSRAATRSAKVKSPAGRFLQIRARWNRDPDAVLHELSVSFVTDNMRALITEITAGKRSSSKSSKKVPASGGPLDDPSTKVKLSWKVDNPDNDKLRYELFYRPVASKRWRGILPVDTTLTKTSYSWNTSGLPEGYYRVRVDASDALSNPPSRATSHSLESRTLLVDNTPPRLTNLTLRGMRLQGTATDGVGPIARIEVALIGSKDAFPLFPSDQVFDDASETFDADISKLIPPGPQLLVVHAYDRAGNRVTRTVRATP